MLREGVFQLLAIPAELIVGHTVSTETQRGRILVSIHPSNGQSLNVENKNSKPLLNYLDFIAILSFLGKPGCNWKNVSNGRRDAFARRIYLN